MKSSEGYAWTPILLPVEEPLNSWISSHLKLYLDSSSISRATANLWHLQTRDEILKEPDLVLFFKSSLQGTFSHSYQVKQLKDWIHKATRISTSDHFNIAAWAQTFIEAQLFIYQHQYPSAQQCLARLQNQTQHQAVSHF